MKKLLATWITIFFLLSAFTANGATPTPCPDFGCFEVLHTVGSFTDGPVISTFLERTAPTVDILDIIFRVGLVTLAALCLIIIIIGGYIYMIAGGDASKVQSAKAWIGAALAGLILGLMSWVLLEAINPKFTSDVKDPKDLVPKNNP